MIHYPEETKDIEKIGGLEMNTEKIVSLKPDLVLAHALMILRMAGLNS